MSRRAPSLPYILAAVVPPPAVVLPVPLPPSATRFAFTGLLPSSTPAVPPAQSIDPSRSLCLCPTASIECSLYSLRRSLCPCRFQHLIYRVTHTDPYDGDCRTALLKLPHRCTLTTNRGTSRGRRRLFAALPYTHVLTASPWPFLATSWRGASPSLSTASRHTSGHV